MISALVRIIEGIWAMIYEVFSGTAGDTWVTHIFARRSKEVSVYPIGDIQVQFSYDGANFDDAFRVPQRWLNFPIEAKAIRVRNYTPGSSIDYQIVVWEIVPRE